MKLSKVACLIIILSIFTLTVPVLALDDDTVDINVTLEPWSSVTTGSNIGSSEWIEGELTTPDLTPVLPEGTQGEFRGEPGETRSAKSSFSVSSNCNVDITINKAGFETYSSFLSEMLLAKNGDLVQVNSTSTTDENKAPGTIEYDLFIELSLPDEGDMINGNELSLEDALNNIEPGTYNENIQITVAQAGGS